MLWCTAFYFFYWEYKELQGYGLRKYMSNAVNAVQIMVFLLIMLVYVPCQLGFIPESVVVREYQLCMSGTICLALWILSLQYLEVHPTAGYLLPMMHGLLLDSVRFSILYGVFQGLHSIFHSYLMSTLVGLTCAYYILLQGSDGYESVLHTFITVYFVLFGQIQTGPIDVRTQYIDMTYEGCRTSRRRRPCSQSSPRVFSCFTWPLRLSFSSTCSLR